MQWTLNPSQAEAEAKDEAEARVVQASMINE